ncbi:hypothetical protein SAMN04490239_1239 [Rhodococcus koreensis]|uniref:Uncharacterized protein n=1 Tax=Rhodococcus koreensis TaxID=99653 RepID=A0A1H4LEC7_9NOCA|nr:hypothetical protein SAMN04490239_1239 [Rhodococcus koreensis]
MGLLSFIVTLPLQPVKGMFIAHLGADASPGGDLRLGRS